MADSEAVAITPIDATQAEAALPLSVEAGWNQTVEDWRFMLKAGRGFGVAAPGGGWQASALVLPVGERLSWISMVLVTKTARRHGLGTGLLRHCLEIARDGGGVAGLDATEQGRPIYLPLGFHDLYPIRRWHFDGNRATTVPGLAGITVNPLQAADLPAVMAYDRARSGMGRAATLAHLAARRPTLAWVARDASRQVVGFVMGRDGRTATSLGPIVAEDELIALLLASRAAVLAGGPVITDVPQAHRGMTRWLTDAGATSPRGYVRMTLGEAPGLEDPEFLFALAGPELG
ncbi:MAG: GNAT family N-acetyltransferase [Reyranellaceae bacterium]